MGAWTSDDGRIEIRCCDALDLLRSLASESVDAVITDPPYGIAKGAAFVRMGGAVVANGDEAMNNASDPFWYMSEAARVVAAGGHLAAFLDDKRYRSGEALSVLESCGLACWGSFHVVNSAPPPTPRPVFCNAVQPCMIAHKPGAKRRWYGGATTGNAYIGIPGTRESDHTGHTAQKPIGAIATLVRALAPPDGLVCDPFLGSGTTAVACVQAGMRFVGCEREPEWFEVAVARVKRHMAQGRLL